MPADAAAKAALDRPSSGSAAHAQGAPRVLQVKGHELRRAAGRRRRRALRFRRSLRQAYGASDYLALGEAFHTLILDEIPVMDFERRNEAKRFIILIDTLYEHHVKLIASADGRAARALPGAATGARRSSSTARCRG